MRSPQAFSTGHIFPALILQKKPQFLNLCGPILDSVNPCFLYLWRPRTGCNSPVVTSSVPSRGKWSLPSIGLIMQLRILFPTFATPVPDWLMASLLSARTLRSFCVDLPSSWLVPCVYWSLSYSFPRSGLCISMTVLPAQLSRPEYLWMAAQLPGASDIPTGFGLKNTVYWIWFIQWLSSIQAL